MSQCQTQRLKPTNTQVSILIWKLTEKMNIYIMNEMQL